MTIDALKVQPSANGVIRISRRGKAKFQFDDAHEPFEVDVIEVSDQWYEIDFSFREKTADDKWILPAGKWNEHGQAQVNFVQGTVAAAYEKIGKPGPTDLTRGEAEAFLQLIAAEVAKLRDFLLPKKETPSSPPASTVPPSTEERFSQ